MFVRSVFCVLALLASSSAFSLAAAATAEAPNPPPLLGDPSDPPSDPSSDPPPREPPSEPPAGDAPPLPAAPDDDAPVFTPAPTQPAPTQPAPTEPQPSSTPPAPPNTARRVRLVYSPGPWADACPALDEVREAIRQHLGYDPVAEPADRVVLLLLDTIDGVEGAAPDRARVELLDDRLKSLGTRSVTSSEGCAELVATAALQVSIAVDPTSIRPRDPRPVEVPPDPTAVVGVTETPPPPPPPPPPTPTPTPTKTVAAPLALPKSPGLFGLSGHIAGGMTPDAIMLGASAYAGFRWDWISTRLELRVDFPNDDTGLDILPLLMTFAPCAHVPLFGTGEDDETIEATACATATGGIVGVFADYNAAGIYGGAGTRLGLDWRFSDAALRAFVQLEGAFVRPQFSNGNGNQFELSPINGLIGVAADLPSL